VCGSVDLVDGSASPPLLRWFPLPTAPLSPPSAPPIGHVFDIIILVYEVVIGFRPQFAIGTVN
jgi:hypothetical protein